MNNKQHTPASEMRYSYNNMTSQELDFGEIIPLIRTNKILLFILMAVSLLISCVYILNTPPQYESTALIQVENRSNGMGNVLQDISLPFSSGIASSASESQIEKALLSSRFILQPTIESLGLNITISPKYFPIFGASHASKHKGTDLSKPFLNFSKYASGGEKLTIRQLVVPNSFFNEKFTLKAGENRGYSLYSPDGDFVLKCSAGKLCESTLSSTIPNVKILVTEIKSRPNVEFIVSSLPMQDVIEKLSDNLTIIDLGMNDVFSDRKKAETGVLSLALQGPDAEKLPMILNTIVYYDIQKNINKKTAESKKTLAFLEKQSSDLKQELDKSETTLSNYKSKQGIGTIDIANQALLDRIVFLEKSIGESKLRKVELLQTFTEQHPYIIAINEQLLKLANELSILETKISSLPKSEQHKLGLERDVRVKDQLYLILLSKIQQLQVIKEGTISDVRILGLATQATKLPSLNAIMIIGSLIFGFVIGLTGIFIRHLIIRRATNPDYVEEHLGVPFYAMVPYSKSQKILSQDMKRNLPGSGPYVLAEKYHRDLSIESLRGLRTTLQFALQESTNNVISILGATPSIGKSFISLNLAYVLADSGKKVLLIDADMRKGKINTYLGQSHSPGMSELLAQSATLEEATRKLRENLDFIATGKYPKNPSELLLNEEIYNSLMDKVSSLYDIIVIDTPPALAVTDSIIIAKRSGINLLLVSCGVEHFKAAEHALKRIQKNDITVNGLIFNNTKIEKHSYGGYGGYGKYYYNYHYYGDDNKRKDK